jgi:threonine/homoserine/homoserine lactone efflux protein
MDIIAQGFLLGLLGGVIPGAVLTILFVSAIRGGFRAALTVFLWAFASEVAIVGILLSIGMQFSVGEIGFRAIGFVGGLFLLYLAREVFKMRTFEGNEEGQAVFGPAKIFTLSLTNAPLYVFWITVCFPLIWELSAMWNLTTAGLSFFAVFELGWAMSTFIMLLMFVFARRTITEPRIAKRVLFAASAFLAILGLKMMGESAYFFFAPLMF